MIEFPKFIFIDDSSVTKRKVTNVKRSEMEAGPNKVRPVQNFGMFNMKFRASIPVNKEHNFDDWFNDDLGYGSRWFILKDPLDGVKKRFRFLDTEIEWTKSGNLLISSFEVEAYDVQSGI